MTEQKKKQEIQQNRVKEPAATYTRNVEIPTFFGRPMLKGEFAEINADSLNPDTPTLFYTHTNGKIYSIYGFV